jgi:hypothetical protein
MNEKEIYKAVPSGWDENNNYLIVKKLISLTSYNSLVIMYEVVKRCSVTGWKKEKVYTHSLNGVQYNKNEIKIIKKYDTTDTDYNYIFNGINNTSNKA